MAKTFNHLKEQICDLRNLIAADKKARKGKKRTKSLIELDKHYLEFMLKLQKSLLDGTYTTSKYKIFTIFEPKEREIFALPYYPDRIVHHAIMNILEPIWKNIFIKGTYSSIKGRGIHAAMKDVKKCLKGYRHRKQKSYFLKLDIRKFYPSIDHDILKSIIKRSIGDKWLLGILDEVIDSADGVPIGNYLSQYFANLYLTYFDHYCKETLKIKNYFRYCDDIVIIDVNKESLHDYFTAIKKYVEENLKLKIKSNYKIAPTTEGIDFTGYVMTPYHTKLRKSIKCKLMQKVIKYSYLNVAQFIKRLGSYRGWLSYGNTKMLKEKIFIHYVDELCNIRHSA